MVYIKLFEIMTRVTASLVTRQTKQNINIYNENGSHWENVCVNFIRHKCCLKMGFFVISYGIIIGAEINRGKSTIVHEKNAPMMWKQGEQMMWQHHLQFNQLMPLTSNLCLLHPIYWCHTRKNKKIIFFLLENKKSMNMYYHFICLVWYDAKNWRKTETFTSLMNASHLLALKSYGRFAKTIRARSLAHSPTLR